MGPGHLPYLYAGTEVIEFSPTHELHETLAVVEQNMRPNPADLIGKLFLKRPPSLDSANGVPGATGGFRPPDDVSATYQCGDYRGLSVRPDKRRLVRAFSLFGVSHRTERRHAGLRRLPKRYWRSHAEPAVGAVAQ